MLLNSITITLKTNAEANIGLQVKASRDIFLFADNNDLDDIAIYDFQITDVSADHDSLCRHEVVNELEEGAKGEYRL